MYTRRALLYKFYILYVMSSITIIILRVYNQSSTISHYIFVYTYNETRKSERER